MDIFKSLIKEISPSLKQIGFIRNGNSFYLKYDKNYGIINFQKSRDSTESLISFTINFGIYSAILGHLPDDYNDSTKPKVEQCQWWARVGMFMPDQPDCDYWWKISTSDSDNLDKIILNVKEAIQNFVIPELNKRLSDEELIKCWLEEEYAGTTEVGRFKYLTTLLKAKGENDILNDVVEKFMLQSKGKPDKLIAKEHLKDLGYSK
jgi:hypothetical protein